MARYKVNGVFRDQAGNIVADGKIEVFITNTTTVAAVYATLAGATSVDHVHSDDDGVFTFYTDDFDYDSEQRFKLYLTHSGYTPTTYNDIIGEIIIGNYTISTAKTVTTYIKSPKGITYTHSTGGSITFNGGFEAGLHQVFIDFDAGDIVFGTLKYRSIQYQWFADDTITSASVPTTGYSLYLSTGVTHNF